MFPLTLAVLNWDSSTPPQVESLVGTVSKGGNIPSYGAWEGSGCLGIRIPMLWAMPGSTGLGVSGLGPLGLKDLKNS